MIDSIQPHFVAQLLPYGKQLMPCGVLFPIWNIGWCPRIREFVSQILHTTDLPSGLLSHDTFFLFLPKNSPYFPISKSWVETWQSYVHSNAFKKWVSKKRTWMWTSARKCKEMLSVGCSDSPDGRWNNGRRVLGGVVGRRRMILEEEEFERGILLASTVPERWTAREPMLAPTTNIPASIRLQLSKSRNPHFLIVRCQSTNIHQREFLWSFRSVLREHQKSDCGSIKLSFSLQIVGSSLLEPNASNLVLLEWIRAQVIKPKSLLIPRQKE